MRKTITISERNAVLAVGIVFTLLVSFIVVGKIKDLNGGESGLVKSGVISSVAASSGQPATQAGTAKVRIVEFSDFQCPYCARVVPTLKRIKENYGDNVDIIFKHFPLNFHQNAKKAAEAAECARDQGRFWEYHDVLFANQNKLTVDYLKQYAGELGLNTRAFDSCLDSGDKTALVESDYAEGQALGVSGTPASFINDQMVSGAQPYEKFAEIIDIMIEVNAGDEPVEAPAEADDLQEVKALAGSDTGGGCGGACGSPSCGAATGGSCGCGG